MFRRFSVLRYGKFVFIPPEKVHGAERWAAKFGSMGIFISRLLPVVRHLISLPAGLARMPLPRFVLFTGLGAAVWCTILTWIGWFIGKREELLRSALDQAARHYAGRAVMILVPILAALAAAYLLWYRRRSSRQEGGN